jgi:hypothetical protein
LALTAVSAHAGLVTRAHAAIVSAMRTLMTCFCIVAPPGWAWEFTPEPICTLSGETDESSVVVTYDPRWPRSGVSPCNGTKYTLS